MSAIVPDRRQSNRVRMGDNVFVCLACPERKPWHILDVSRGGLSYRYVDGQEKKGEAAELEIVSRDNVFSLEKLPFKPISDSELTGHPGPFRLRRRGIQFGDLTQLQIESLDHLVSFYSASLV
jgi:hypothetical protein